MKKQIIIASMAVIFTATGMAGAQGSANQKEVIHGQTMTHYQYGKNSPVLVQQYKKMLAEFISVHKQMVKENPGMQDLSVTAGLSPQMAHQHREMLEQLISMQELITSAGYDMETCFDQSIRKDLKEMQKIYKMSSEDIPDKLII